MHPEVYKAFVALFEEYSPPDGPVLEIGAGASIDGTLLGWFVKTGRYECTGIDLQVRKDTAGLPFTLLDMNSNDMSAFEDNSFRVVICNAVLEHDPYFWLTLREIRRVLMPGGLFFVGVPGYSSHRSRLQQLALRPFTTRPMNRFRGSIYISERLRLSPLSGTSTLWYHAAPQDFYRFSEDALRQVFLQDMECLTFRSILAPPRISAVGRYAGE